jgi:hypothetical protein
MSVFNIENENCELSFAEASTQFDSRFPTSAGHFAVHFHCEPGKTFIASSPI